MKLFLPTFEYSPDGAAAVTGVAHGDGGSDHLGDHLDKQ
jgi:hypothetical protein